MTDVLWFQRQAELYEELLGSLEQDHSPLTQDTEILLRAMAGDARQAEWLLRNLLQFGSGREAA
jgi:hypothetical protein